MCYDIVWYLSFSFWLTSLSMIISRSIHVAANDIISFFLWLKNWDIYRYRYMYIFIHPLTATKVVSISWPLWIMLQWTWRCSYLFELLFSFSLNKYPEVGLLDPVIVLFLNFCVTYLVLSVVAKPIYIATNRAQGFPLLHILKENPCALLVGM